MGERSEIERDEMRKKELYRYMYVPRVTKTCSRLRSPVAVFGWRNFPSALPRGCVWLAKLPVCAPPWLCLVGETSRLRSPVAVFGWRNFPSALPRGCVWLVKLPVCALPWLCLVGETSRLRSPWQCLVGETSRLRSPVAVFGW